MIYQKQHKRQYLLHKDEYDSVYNDIMTKGLDANGPYTKKVQNLIKEMTGRKHVFMLSLIHI